MSDPNTDDLEESLITLICDWQDGQSTEDAVFGAIQAAGRVFIFFHDLYAEIRRANGEPMNDKQQLEHLLIILHEEMPHVHEHSSVKVTIPLDS